MKFRIATILLLILSFSPGADAQVPSRAQPFRISAVQASDDTGKVYIDTELEIKYSRLVFFRQEETYRAGYRVFLQFYAGGEDRMVKGEVFSGEVEVGSYSETRSFKRAVNINRKIYLPPEDYEIRAEVEVKGTRIRYSTRTDITLSESDIFISDPEFLISPAEPGNNKPPAGEIRLSSGSSDMDRFIRRVSGVYTDPGSWLRGSLTISSPASRGEVEVSVKIMNRGDQTISYNRDRFAISSDRTVKINVDVNVDDYEPGSYILAVHASDGVEKSGFQEDFVILFNLQALMDDFQDTIDLISLVASDEELNVLAGAEPSARLEAWRKFWQGRTGNNLDDFRDRISYAAENFSGSRPGWETDMGRVYIRNGKPDRAVTRWSRWGGERYNFWYYYSLGIMYVFVDNFGTGEFRLIDTRNI